jgi:hypothetical protein
MKTTLLNINNKEHKENIHRHFHFIVSSLCVYKFSLPRPHNNNIIKSSKAETIIIIWIPSIHTSHNTEAQEKINE